MKLAIALAFGIAAAPAAYAQQLGTQPGNTQKDSDTADAQRNAPSGQQAVDEAKQLDKQEKARARKAQREGTAAAGNEELSTDQVRQEKKKATTRARAMKQQRAEKGGSHWNTLSNPKTDQSAQSGSAQTPSSAPSGGGAGSGVSGDNAGSTGGAGAPASGGSGR